MFSNTKEMALLYLTAVFFIVLDRFAKVYFLSYHNNIKIIGDYLSLNFAKNPYIAFSIPVSPSIIKYLSLVFGLLIILFFIKFLKEKKRNIAFLTFLLTLGSFSNIFDRFRYGFVIDYINLKYFTIFNIADSMILISILFLGYNIYTIDKAMFKEPSISSPQKRSK